jgi:hypothetical protein
MTDKYLSGSSYIYKLCLACWVVGGLLSTGVAANAAQSLQTTKDILEQYGTGAYGTTVAYVADFVPLWFTYSQFRYSAPFGATNAFVGAKQVTSLYHFCVAINDDTLYTSVYFDLRAEPVVVTIPQTTLRYTTLTLDPYGTTIEPGSRRHLAFMRSPDLDLSASCRSGLRKSRCQSTSRAFMLGRSNIRRAAKT